MNTTSLSKIVNVLLDGIQRHRIVKLLGTFQGHLTNLVSNPANPPFQTEVSTSMEQLADATTALLEELEPSEVKAIEDIGGSDYFVVDFPAEFKQWMTENAATPAAAKDKIDKFAKQFTAYVETLNQLKTRLKEIGVNPLDLKDGAPEIGFLIPRDMFHNHLDGMISQLRNVNIVIRAFSEFATGNVQSAEVRSISTTDPLYFFGMPVEVIVAIGGAVTWAISVWKQVEEIREIRSRTLDIATFPKKWVQENFGKLMEDHVDAAVEKKVGELFHDRKKVPGRDPELRQTIHWSLEYILAAIERGMIIEIRHLPPPPKPADAEQTVPDGPYSPNAVANLAKGLSFPEVDPNKAVLKLPSAPERPESKTK